MAAPDFAQEALAVQGLLRLKVLVPHECRDLCRLHSLLHSWVVRGMETYSCGGIKKELNWFAPFVGMAGTGIFMAL